MRKTILSLPLCLALMGGTAVAADQIYKKENLITWNRDNVAGGLGTLYGQFSHTRNEAPADWALKEIGWMTLKPGASIGMHKHEVNEDTYIIVSGEGVFTDSQGKERHVKGGDITIARKGDQHALKNTGTEDLVFLDIIGHQ